MDILFYAQRIIPDMVSIGCLWGQSMTCEEGSFSTPFVLLNFAASEYITCSKLNYFFKKTKCMIPRYRENIHKEFLQMYLIFSLVTD